MLAVVALALLARNKKRPHGSMTMALPSTLGKRRAPVLLYRALLKPVVQDVPGWGGTSAVQGHLSCSGRPNPDTRCGDSTASEALSGEQRDSWGTDWGLLDPTCSPDMGISDSAAASPATVAAEPIRSCFALPSAPQLRSLSRPLTVPPRRDEPSVATALPPRPPRQKRRRSNRKSDRW